MKMEERNDIPRRKPIRIEDYDYSTPGAYFITVCTANREKIFWNGVGADSIRPQNVPLSTAGKIAEQGILQVAEHYENVVVDKYCIMPDHIHMILRIESDIDGRIVSAPTVNLVGAVINRPLLRPYTQAEALCVCPARTQCFLTN